MVLSKIIIISLVDWKLLTNFNFKLSGNSKQTKKVSKIHSVLKGKKSDWIEFKRINFFSAKSFFPVTVSSIYIQHRLCIHLAVFVKADIIVIGETRENFSFYSVFIGCVFFEIGIFHLSFALFSFIVMMMMMMFSFCWQ